VSSIHWYRANTGVVTVVLTLDVSEVMAVDVYDEVAEVNADAEAVELGELVWLFE
jgi:hypothetical protein